MVNEFLEHIASSSSIQWPPYNDMIVTTHQILHGSSLVLVQLAASILKVIPLLNPLNISCWEAAAMPFPFEIPPISSSLVPSIILTLGMVPFKDWDLLFAFVRDNEAAPIIQAVTGCDCKVATRLCSILGDELSADPRFNCKALDGVNVRDVEMITSLCNRMYIWLWFNTRRVMDVTPKKKEIGKSSKADKLTVLQMSYAVKEGNLGETTVPHKSVLVLASLEEHIYAFIRALYQNLDVSFSLTNDETIQLVTGLRWLSRFINFCSQVVPKSSFHLFVPQMALHWQKLEEELLKKIPNSWNDIIPIGLHNAVNKMNEVFLTQYGPIYQLAVQLRQHLHNPSAFLSADTANVDFVIDEILNDLKPSLANHTNNSILASSKGKELLEKIVEISECNVKNEFDGLMEECNEIQDVIKIMKKDVTSSSQSLMNIQAWPLSDLLILLALNYNFSRCETSVNKKHIEILQMSPIACYLSLSSNYNYHSIAMIEKYKFLTNCTATLQPKYWILYNGFESDDEEPPELQTVSPVSSILTYIFATYNSSNTVPLNMYNEKKHQIKQLRSTIWNNWKFLSNEENSYEQSFIRTSLIFAKSLLVPIATTIGSHLKFETSICDIEKLTIFILESISATSDSVIPSFLKGIKAKIIGLRNSNDNLDKLRCSAELMIICGIMQSWLFGHLEPLDPVQSRKIICEYKLRESDELKSEIILHSWIEKLLGKDKRDSESNHPFVPLLKSAQADSLDHANQLQKEIVYRPDHAEYHKLCTYITNFNQNIFNPERLNHLLADASSNQSVLTQIKTTINSCDTFIKQIHKDYRVFYDIYTPVLHGVASASEGLHVLLALAETLSNNSYKHLSSLLSEITVVPSIRQADKPLSNLNKVIDLTKSVAQLVEERNIAVQHMGQGLRIALLETYNSIVASEHVTEDTFMKLNSLVEEAVIWWNKKEEEKRRKKEEEESLYRFKPKTVESETEGEKDERLYKETFPSFTNDFEDLEDFNLEESTRNPSQTNSNINSVVWQLSDDEFYEICRTHSNVVMNYAESLWYQPSKVKLEEDVVAPLLLKSSMVDNIITELGSVASNELDRSMLGIMMIKSHHKYKSIETGQRLEGQQYDIYRDSNVEEVRNAQPILTALLSRINDLLLEWPSHPTLELIKSVIKRVLSFDIASPLIRFIIGLETVLEKSQEWEKNAHKGVSLMEHLTVITEKVIQWRTLELNMWKVCLTTVTDKVHNASFQQWWPHLYCVFNSEMSDDISLKNFSDSIKQFMESATLGDFKCRLELILTFHCHLILMKKYKKISNEQLAISWNLYSFYNQFSNTVANTCINELKPVEKSVKDYIKIARWNDINFFAVKESVDKSRRTLHKHMRDWEKKLNKLAASTFRDSIQDVSSVDDKEVKPSNKSVKLFTMIPELKESSVKTLEVESKIIERIPKFTKRSHELIDKTMKNVPYVEYCKEVEDLSIDIITTHQELSNLNSKAELENDKDKRIQMLKFVMKRRRDSLADLFKILANMGIVYTRGNNLWKPEFLDKGLLASPVNLTNAHGNKFLIKLWESCEKHFFKNISRQTSLISGLQHPHDDLGPEVIKRLRGSTCHLMMMVQDIRTPIGSLSDNVSELRDMIEDLNTSVHSVESNEGLNFVKSLHNSAASLLVIISEEKALLNSFIDEDSLFTVDSKNLIRGQSIQESIQILDEIQPNIKNSIVILSNLLSSIEKDYRIMNITHQQIFKDQISCMNDISTKVLKVIKIFGVDEKSQLTKALSHWNNSWNNLHYSLLMWFENLSKETNNESELISAIEELITCVLLGIENTYKTHCSGSGNKLELKNEDDEVASVSLPDQLITSLISDLKKLRHSDVLILLKYIMKSLKGKVSNNILNILKNLTPLLQQYLALCENMLCIVVDGCRASAKLLSILQGIFQQMAVKGFCRPQEIEDEGESQGSMKFEDSEGTGLGEGEGKKDVSDKIESEDQLESALKEGENEEKGDTDLKEEEKGIEMDDDFEGKTQDIQQNEEENENSDDEGNDEEELDKQMGETEKGSDKIDEKLWGDDEPDDEKQESKDEEDGPGDGEQTESEMVAKDDNKDKTGKDDKKPPQSKEQKELEEMEEDPRKENKQTNEEEDYGDDYVDNYAGEEDKPLENEEDPMQLDDDIALDQDEQNNADSGEEDNDRPEDIEEKALFPEEEHVKKDKEEESKETGDDEEGGGDDTKEKDVNGDEDDNDNVEDGNKDEVQHTADKNDDNEENNEDQTDDTQEESEASSKTKETNDKTQAADMDTSEGSRDMTQSSDKKEVGGEIEEDKENAQDDQGDDGEKTEDKQGVGESDSQSREESHSGEKSQLSTQDVSDKKDISNNPKKPGETDESRVLGKDQHEVNKGLMTAKPKKQKELNVNEEAEQNKESENEPRGLESHEYEHIKKCEEQWDKQLVDAATKEQAQQPSAPIHENDAPQVEDEDQMQNQDELMEVDEVDNQEEDIEEMTALKQESRKSKDTNEKRKQGNMDNEEGERGVFETEGEIVLESTVQRAPDPQIHTLMRDDNVEDAIFDENVLSIRNKLEQSSVDVYNNQEGIASWSEEEARMSPLALQLCEQLRLILEPTEASKLKGDYRTGKRLNMRKVIAYIASGFRKDKIWLRRTQPNKRNYHILLAVDDSQSMLEVNADVLAKQSVALVSKALTLLEAGQLGILSFGATTKLLHPLDQQFSDAAGSKVFSNLKFDQKETNFARMLEDSVALLSGAKTKSSSGNPDTAQLLLILSDGQTHARSEAVRAAVKAARAARIFIVFLVLDAESNKFSFYDVMIWDNGKLTPLVESFPFPFFLVVRDMNGLPEALATALRQWFELVTADAH